MLCLFILLYNFISSNVTIAQSAGSKAELVGVFDGRTPCQELAKQFNEPVTKDCFKLKWRLKLYKNGADTSAGTYALEGSRYRGDKALKGTWQLTKGTKADPNAVVYKLSNDVKGDLYFIKADDGVLLFLDGDKNIRIGNRLFSYALYNMMNAVGEVKSE